MKYNPLVSIITPTFNHEEFIGQCIESVLSQTYSNWEQIIIDDGSTDATEKIIAQYKDKRIKYIKQDNVGIWRLSESYNKALIISKGEFIAVLEGDDFWPPDKLDKQVPVFKDPKVVLSWGNAIVINRKGKILYKNSLNVKWFEKRSKEEVLRELILHNFITACTTMCRKNVLQSIGGFKQSQQFPSVDYPTWLEISQAGELKPIGAVLGFWRRHENQISRSMLMEMTNARNHLAISFFQRLPESVKSRINLSMDELLNRCESNTAALHYYIGRMSLAEHRWMEARKNFYSTLSKGTPSIKIKAIFGIGCSFFRLDLEWIARMIHEPCLNDLR